MDIKTLSTELDMENDNSLEKSIIGFYRNSNEKIETIVSDSSKINTERHIDMSNFDDSLNFLYGGWRPTRDAKIVPLTLEKTDFLSISKSEDYDKLPDGVKSVFESGYILRTSLNPRTEFSVLMYVLDSHPPQGRTGTLLYKGKPITVEIDGKQFIVEIKGVGVPNGDNSISVCMARSSYFGQGRAKYGGLEVDQGKREFRNLEILRVEGSETFQDKNSPRAVLLIEYDGKVRYWGDETNQAYLLRLSPATVRASFSENRALPKVENKSNLTAKSLAKQFVETMNLDSILIHTCAHSENLVMTNNGYKFTDFSDVRKLAELENPHKIVRRTFTEYVDEIPNRKDKDITDYSRTICDGLKIEWQEQYKNPEDLAEAIWKQYIAPKVFELRKSGNNVIREKTLREIEECVKSPDVIDAKIIEEAKSEKSYYESEAQKAKEEIDDLTEWIPKFKAIQGNTKECRKFYKGRFDNSDDKQLLELAKHEYERRVARLSKVRKRLQEYMQKAHLLQQYEGEPRKLAEIEPDVIPIEFSSALRGIIEYLENEIDLLTAFRTEEAMKSLKEAQNKLIKIKSVRKDEFSNCYPVVDELRKDPNYLFALTDLPYLSN